MAAAIVPIWPASNSGRKWLASTFLRSRLSYKTIGKSKCKSTIPWRWRRVIRSSVDSDEGLICFQRSLTDEREESASHAEFWGAHAPRVLALAPLSDIIIELAALSSVIGT